MTEEVAEDVFQKIELMTNVQERSAREGFLASFFNVDELSTAFKYAVLPRLADALPSRFDDIVSHVRIGLASDDESEVHRAMRALESWLAESVDGSRARVPPPNDLVHEIGVVIATRRKARADKRASIC